MPGGTQTIRIRAVSYIHIRFTAWFFSQRFNCMFLIFDKSSVFPHIDFVVEMISGVSDKLQGEIKDDFMK